MNNERAFGIEIEFVGAMRGDVANYMRRHHVACKVEGYNHTNQSYWKIVTDASVRSAGAYNQGFELVSPKLYGQDGLDQLKVACDALLSAGAIVNKSCGLHVHHDASDYNSNQFESIFNWYKKFEDSIDTMMPKSRRGSGKQYIASLQNISFSRIYDTRYYKLNLNSYHTHGTIEFDKISNWVLFTQMAMQKCAKRKVKISNTTHTRFLDMMRSVGIGFGEKVGGKNTDEQNQLRDFYRNRRAELKRTYSTRRNAR